MLPFSRSRQLAGRRGVAGSSLAAAAQLSLGAVASAVRVRRRSALHKSAGRRAFLSKQRIFLSFRVQRQTLTCIFSFYRPEDLLLLLYRHCFRPNQILILMFPPPPSPPNGSSVDNYPVRKCQCTRYSSLNHTTVIQVGLCRI